MKRRLFNLLFASAPALGMPVGGEKYPSPSPSVAPYMGDVTNMASNILGVAPSPLEILRRKKQHEFYTACRVGERLMQARSNLWYATSFDHNINALKSVSIQHKVRMMRAQEERERNAHKSWVQKLADNLDIPWDAEQDCDADDAQPAQTRAGW